MRQFLILFLLLAPTFAFSATTDFSRTLYVGMRGEDVRGLQEFLNTDPETRIAESGAGSLGSETDYFGAGTKRALIKFQEKYRSEILLPSGLLKGTGVLGVKTRQKISMLANKNTPAQASTTTPPSLKETQKISVQKGDVVVMFPSQYSGKSGTMITISGAGFTPKDNTIYFGAAHAVIKASSWNGQSITFKVPDIPKGLYPLYVVNERGESNKEQWFVVTDGVSPEPKIEIITPQTATRGDAVVVKGSGFLAKENTIMVSGVGLFKNVVSTNGTSLSFIIPQNAFSATFSSSTISPSLPISVRVINENGVSNRGEVLFKL